MIPENHTDPAPIDRSQMQYAGFWVRVAATLLDTLLLSLLIYPTLLIWYGAQITLGPTQAQGMVDLVLRYCVPPLATIAFWYYCQATPGKMAFRAKVVDARTGGKPSILQLVGRYLAYIPSFLLLGLGVIWVGIDPRKQGWHDKLAGTLVLRPRRPAPPEVRFTGQNQTTQGNTRPEQAANRKRYGSSPHTPGTLEIVIIPAIGSGQRFIPAPTGNTMLRCKRTLSISVHPRTHRGPVNGEAYQSKTTVHPRTHGEHTHVYH